MAVDGIRGMVEAAIQRASKATGVDFSFLMKTAGRESGMNPRAQAGSSSAAGLFQFVDQTWLQTLKQHGAKHGYARYADLITRVGANVQPGQTVFITAFVEHAPLARALGRAGYAAGARLVDVRYVDNHLRRAFIEHAAEDDLTESSPWLLARTDAIADGGALIMIAGDPEPELLADLDQQRVGKARPVAALQRQLEFQNEKSVNWTIAAYPTEGQAVQMFGEPDVERLWEAIARTVRLDEPDPVAAWRAHSERLGERCKQLDQHAFDAVRFSGPGTDVFATAR